MKNKNMIIGAAALIVLVLIAFKFLSHGGAVAASCSAVEDACSKSGMDEKDCMKAILSGGSLPGVRPARADVNACRDSKKP